MIYEGDIVKVKMHTVSLNIKYIIADIQFGEYMQSKCDEYDCEHYGYFLNYKWEDYCENTGIDLNEINKRCEIIRKRI